MALFPNIIGTSSQSFYQTLCPNGFPLTNGTPSYLTETLKLTYKDKLQVFVSKDNKHFINHPDVTQLVTMSAEEFASHVFQNHQSGKETKDARTRYYLRTFSMPEILFRDVDMETQVDSLLHVLVLQKEDEFPKGSDVNGLRCQHDSDETQCEKKDVELPREEGDFSSKDFNSNIADNKKDEPISVWEDFLSPDSSSEEDDVPDGISTNVSDGHIGANKSVQSTETKLQSSDSVVEHQTGKTRFQEAHSRIFNSQTMQLWIGTRGNVTPLHYDRNHGLLTQISGCKELVLFSHEDTQFLYPHSSFSDRAHTSRINLRQLGDSSYAELFSKLEEAQPYSCVLQPGELLYTPPFWWHDVTSLDNCVSITLPWDIEGYEEVPPCMMR